MLKVSGVHARYGNIAALRGVDLEIGAGEIVALIGANGAGKSTLLMTLCGRPRAARGQILFEGRDITRLSTFEIVRLRIAQVPEGRRIFPRMTVLENLQDRRVDRRSGLVRGGSRARLCAVSDPRAAPEAARRHAFRRGAADAGDRPGVDEPAAAAAARRALARLGASRRQADLRRDSAKSTSASR